VIEMPKIKSKKRKVKSDLSPFKSKLGKGIGIQSQSKEILINFYNYLKNDMKTKNPKVTKTDVIS
jgi:hypothetical protein